MWLPKNERLLLRYYYSKLEDKYNGHLDLDKEILIASMKLLNCYSEHDENMCIEPEIMRNPAYARVTDARGHLEDRGLLVQGIFYSNSLITTFCHTPKEPCLTSVS